MPNMFNTRLLKEHAYLQENNLVQESSCDVKLEVQAAKLYVDSAQLCF